MPSSHFISISQNHACVSRPTVNVTSLFILSIIEEKIVSCCPCFCRGIWDWSLATLQMSGGSNDAGREEHIGLSNQICSHRLRKLLFGP